MKSSILFFFFLILCYCTHAQGGLSAIAGARGAGLGHAGVTFEDINAAFSNQAGLANVESIEVMLVGEQRFLKSPIPSGLAAVAYPSNFGTFALSLNYFGIAAYNEQKIGLAYARKLFDQLRLGIQFNYLNTRIEEFGSSGTFTVEAGLQVELLPDLQLGFHLYNPTNAEFIEAEPLPVVYKAGIAYTPSPKTYLLLEVEKHIDHTASVKAGVEYELVEQLRIRAGVATAPNLVTMGASFQITDRIDIEAAASYHQILGISPTFAFVGNF